MIGDALRRLQCGVDGEAIFSYQMRDDGLAVADRLAVVDDVGQLPARRAMNS